MLKYIRIKLFISQYNKSKIAYIHLAVTHFSFMGNNYCAWRCNILKLSMSAAKQVLCGTLLLWGWDFLIIRLKVCLSHDNVSNKNSN